MAKSKKGSAADITSLENALSQIEKQFGEGTIMHLDNDAPVTVDCINTGSLSLDIALGGKGIPRGRIIELYGPESSGKTTLALHCIAEAQKLGGVAAFVDAEHALDPTWAKKIGVNLEGLLVSQPDSGEQALSIVEMLVKSNAVDIIVVDSVAALTPQAELNGEIGDSHVGLQARLMSQAMRKLTAIISKTKTCLVFINQIREKVGVMFGSPETTPGGRALKFYSSVRLDIRRVSTMSEGEKAVGNHVRVKVVKNKIAPPFRTCEFDIMFHEGISREGDMIDMAVLENIVQKSGAFMKYKGETIGQGREKAKEYLKEHPEIFEEIQYQILINNGIIKPENKEEAIEASEEETEVEIIEEPARKKGGKKKAGK